MKNLLAVKFFSPKLSKIEEKYTFFDFEKKSPNKNLILGFSQLPKKIPAGPSKTPKIGIYPRIWQHCLFGKKEPTAGATSKS